MAADSETESQGRIGRVVDRVDTPKDWISSLVVAVKPMYWSKAYEQSTQKKWVSKYQQ